MKKVRGVYTALVTPFDVNGQLDEEGLRENIRFQIANDIDGLVALGTTGEAPTLSAQEKERIVQITVEEAKGKSVVMVGTGSYSTEQAIENTRMAERLGADMILLVTPYYNKPTQEGIYRHCQAVAESVSIPVVLYNIQGRTGVNITTDTLKRLSTIPNIIGVKEASGQISQMSDVIEFIARDNHGFSVMSGDDALTLPLMALGGDGVISVVSNLVPHKVKALVTAMQKENYHVAKALHFELMPLFRGAFVETNPIPIKAAMAHLGMAAGGCRLPLCELTPENAKKLRELLDTLELELLLT